MVVKLVDRFVEADWLTLMSRCYDCCVPDSVRPVASILQLCRTPHMPLSRLGNNDMPESHVPCSPRNRCHVNSLPDSAVELSSSTQVPKSLIPKSNRLLVQAPWNPLQDLVSNKQAW